jgi:molecular chaperone IbpA
MSLQGGYVMTAFDFTPLYRASVGFDRLPSLLDSITKFDQAPSYPPCNIERTGENAYRITMAVAGFAKEDVAIQVENGTLTVSGSREEKDDPSRFVYRGIAGRNFERRFQLAEHVEVRSANLENGLLHIDLVREIPEALKPRRIEIGTGKPRHIEGKAA